MPDGKSLCLTFMDDTERACLDQKPKRSNGKRNWKNLVEWCQKLKKINALHPRDKSWND